ncbi:hypothetical protein H0S62_03665 [Acinetobacter baumannii]|nr:hypothetical protein H0S62_03665 [Acinetobacter baumannii]
MPNQLFQLNVNCGMNMTSLVILNTRWITPNDTLMCAEKTGGFNLVN